MRHQPSASIRVLVSDDTRVHTELLADALKRDGCLQVTTSSASSESLTARPNLCDIDVLLISSNLDERPGRGFEVLRGLRASHADLRAVVLLDSSKADTILEAFRAGARGVFSKNDSVDILSKCLRKVYEGEIWANGQQIATLVQALASSHNIRAVDARGLSLLSKREMEVVRSVAQGLSNREIADRLHLSQHTIKNCLFRIFDKLGVSSRVELLFMTLSQERHAQSVFQHFLNEQAYESLQDEATLIATQNAADQGVLMAQLALAQYYSAHRTNLTNALYGYMWYSIASEQMSQAYKDATKGLTMDQLLQAEQMAAERPRKRKTVFAVDERRGRAKVANAGN
ncbi:MAG: response regulator transcription factor [Candidatus Korobacteraceae bacterium]